jgi:hypothetical protein
MDALLNLLFLYIIFMLFSSLFKKVNSPKRFQNQAQSAASPQTLSDDIQAIFKHYARKVEQYLNQTSPSTQSDSSRTDQFKTSQKPFPPVEEQAVHFTLESTDRELEHLITPDQQRLAQDMFSRPQRSPQPNKRKETLQSKSFTSAFRNPRTILHGIVISEILGPPLSKRPRSSKRKE